MDIVGEVLHENLIELPDDILVKILSLLPTKEAAATSVLSKGCLPPTSWKVANEVAASFFLERDLPPLPEKMGFVSLIYFLKDQSCTECKGRIHTHRKVIIFSIKELRKTHAIIWTKLEEKQEGQIEYVTRRETKAAATSVLSKGWSSLWKQEDVVYVEFCKKCSTLWVFFVLSLHSVFNRVFGGIYLEKGIPLVPENMDLVSFLLFLKVQECSECKGMMHTHKKVTIFIIREWGKTHAVIWTVPRSLDPLACFSSYLILDKNRSLGKVHENSVCVFVWPFFIPTLSLVIDPPPIRNNLTIKLKTSPMALCLVFFFLTGKLELTLEFVFYTKIRKAKEPKAKSPKTILTEQ
ncbi:hypothetical protein YC2023_074265 [Brassica napus]